MRDLKVPVGFGARPGDNQLETLRQFPPGTFAPCVPEAQFVVDTAQAKADFILEHLRRL